MFSIRIVKTVPLPYPIVSTGVCINDTEFLYLKFKTRAFGTLLNNHIKKLWNASQKFLECCLISTNRTHIKKRNILKRNNPLFWKKYRLEIKGFCLHPLWCTRPTNQPSWPHTVQNTLSSRKLPEPWIPQENRPPHRNNNLRHKSSETNHYTGCIVVECEKYPPLHNCTLCLTGSLFSWRTIERGIRE